MSRRLLKAVVGCALAGVLVWLSVPGISRANATRRLESEAPPSFVSAAYESLSSYWHANVRRWESLIVQEGNRRKLDPDFVAALVWMESRGDADAVGPVGSVGLMQVMPKEEGFSWRPSREELLDPYTNVFWGTRTLSTVIHQGDGDVFSALAAYNGGWEKVSSRVPQAFAATILHDYARAVAVRNGIEGSWSAFFAIQDATLHGPIWVTSSDKGEVYLYGDVNVTPEGAALIPAVTPTAVLADCVDAETGRAYTVGIWLYRTEAREWVTTGAVPIVEAVLQSVLTSPSMMAGSQRLVTSEPPAPTATAAPVTPPPTPTVAATTALLQAAVPSTPQAPEPAAATPTPAVSVACVGGPLVLDTYPLERYNTVDGWRARIYASARGGNCTYDYAWNIEQEIQGTGYSGPIVFEVHSTRRGNVIVGTVLVMSGGETVRVALYITPPGD